MSGIEQVKVNFRAVAKEYRTIWESPDGVIVFNSLGDVCGWCNKLGDPDAYESGCVVVDETDTVWIAIGEDDYGAATTWEQHQENKRI